MATALLTPAASHAAKAEVTAAQVTPPCDPFMGCPPPATVHSLSYAGAPGEVNTVTVERSSSAYTIRDATAVVEAGSGCSASDEHTVVCGPASAIPSFDLGDLADAIDAGRIGTGATYAGGAGDDVLRSADGRDVIDAGAGSDTIVAGGGDDTIRGGGGGNDSMSGGPGRDTLADDDDPAAPDADVLDGGAGFDSADYSQRVSGVIVDLARADGSQGQPGEGDRFTEINGVQGGGGVDLLIGTAGDDRLHGNGEADRIAAADGDDFLSGGAGDDRLQSGEGNDAIDGGAGEDFMSASAGNDTLVGGSGQDTFIGGPGRDELDTNDGLAESIACGRGTDLVESEVRIRLGPGDYAFDRYGQLTDSELAGPDASDILGRDCELVHTAEEDLRAVPRSATANLLVFASPCISRCRGTLVVRVRGRTIARSRFRADGTKPLRVSTRRLPRGAVAQLTWTLTDGFGDPFGVAYRMILRREP